MPSLSYDTFMLVILCRLDLIELFVFAVKEAGAGKRCIQSGTIMIIRIFQRVRQ